MNIQVNAYVSLGQDRESFNFEVAESGKQTYVCRISFASYLYA